MTEYEYMDDTESLWSLDEDFQCEKADKVGDLLPFTPSYVPPDLLPPTDETHNTSSA